MGELKASPRNSLLGLFSDTLRPVRDFGDKAHIPDWVPLLGGSGIGELLMGKSPELLDDLSYNLSSGIRGGNAATGGLGTLTLDKRSADLGMTAADVAGLSAFALRKALKNSLTDTVKESRRQFMFGKNEGLGKATPESLVDTSKPIADGIDAVSSIPVDRRTFLKGAAAAGAAASIPTMLRKFGKEGGETAAKAAEHTVDNIATNAPKYKYNSLKEYLDDVTDYSHDVGHERAYESMMESGYNNHPGADRYMDDFIDNFDFSKIQRERLLNDEAEHKAAKFFYKDNLKDPQTGKWINPYDGQPHSEEFLKNIRNTTNDFSPQARKEMKAVKEFYPENWHSQVNSSEFKTYLDNYGIIHGPQDSHQFYWNGKTPIDTEFKHLNPNSGGYNFWDETGSHGLSEGKATKKELEEAFRFYVDNYL